MTEIHTGCQVQAPISFFELDLHCPAATAEFERAFFAAFAPVTTNRLIRRLWQWDETNARLRTAVPYRHQVIFAERDDRGALSTVLALALHLEQTQSAFYGFQVPPGPGHCEALAFFGLGRRTVRGTRAFWNRSRTALAARGYSTIYGTCAPRVMPVYHFAGGTIEQTRQIENETRYFFRLPVDGSRHAAIGQ